MDLSPMNLKFPEEFAVSVSREEGKYRVRLEEVFDDEIDEEGFERTADVLSEVPSCDVWKEDNKLFFVSETEDKQLAMDIVVPILLEHSSLAEFTIFDLMSVILSSYVGD